MNYYLINFAIFALTLLSQTSFADFVAIGPHASPEFQHYITTPAISKDMMTFRWNGKSYVHMGMRYEIAGVQNVQFRVNRLSGRTEFILDYDRVTRATIISLYLHFKVKSGQTVIGEFKIDDSPISCDDTLRPHHKVWTLPVDYFDRIDAVELFMPTSVKSKNCP